MPRVYSQLFSGLTVPLAGGAAGNSDQEHGDRHRSCEPVKTLLPSTHTEVTMLVWPWYTSSRSLLLSIPHTTINFRDFSNRNPKSVGT